MRLELITGAVDAASTDDTGVARALDDAASSIAARDALRAAVAFDFLAERRFSVAVAESRRAFELALDALSVARDALDDSSSALERRVASSELAGSAARVVAASARGLRFASDARGAEHATIALERTLWTAIRAREVSVRSPRAVTSSVLALMAIGSEQSTSAAARASGELGAFAFETPNAAMEHAHAIAYGVLETGYGVDAAMALVEAWERPLDSGVGYARARLGALGGGATRRVLENAIASAAVPRAAVAELLDRCGRDGRIGVVYLLASIFRASVALKDAELMEACANSLLSSARALEVWLSQQNREITSESRAFACISSISSCLDMDAPKGTLRSLSLLVARAVCKSFALSHELLLLCRAQGYAPGEASLILQDLVTSPIYLTADFIAQTVCQHDGLDPQRAIDVLVHFSAHWYATALELNSPEFAGWVDEIDRSVLIPARAVVHEFSMIILRNAMRGRLDLQLGAAMAVLANTEFSRAGSVEYTQVLGNIATAIGDAIPRSDAPIAMALLDSLPALAGPSWQDDEMLSSRVHLALRLLPFAVSRFSVKTIIDRVIPYVRQCCEFSLHHVVKAAHVAYVAIFHAHPELNESLFPEYLRMALERYPASTPVEPLIAAVGLATRFGQPGSRIAIHIASEISQKVKSMDSLPPAPSASDPPAEPLRRLLFQLITLVDFPLIPVIQDILQDAVLDGSDSQTRSKRHQTLAYTVMRCPDYARKSLMVDWVMRMTSKL